jgi:hypothetical protein
MEGGAERLEGKELQEEGGENKSSENKLKNKT